MPSSAGKGPLTSGGAELQIQPEDAREACQRLQRRVALARNRELPIGMATARSAAGRIPRMRASGVAIAFGMIALVAACTSREETSSGPARTTTTVAAAPNPVASAEF